jgi:hypothetical protein
LVEKDVDGLDDEHAEAEWVEAKVGEVDDVAAERKKDSAMTIVVAVVSPIPGTVASDDIVSAGVNGSVGVLTCYRITGEMSTEVRMGSCSSTRIYCCCPSLGHQMIHQKEYLWDSLFLLPVVSFWRLFEQHLKQAPVGGVADSVADAVAERLGGKMFVDDAVEIVDDIVNPHYLRALRDTVAEVSTLQEVVEWAGKQLVS